MRGTIASPEGTVHALHTVARANRAEAADSKTEVASALQTRPEVIAPCVRSDAVASLDSWRHRNPFYHRRLVNYVRFMVPEGESVLMIGCEDGALLSALRPARGVGVDSAELIAAARARNPAFTYTASLGNEARGAERFDYVVINDVLDDVHDVFTLLRQMHAHCTPTARIVVIHPNYLWRPLRRVAALFGTKCHRTRPNLLSAGDLRVILEGVGFETIDVKPKLFSPRKLLGIGLIANWMGGLMPFSHRLASLHVIVARPEVRTEDPASKTATIVMAMRDERDNVEPMVRATPHVGRECEILIVEGHSQDGTRAEIERIIKAYPEKNVRLLIQSGNGVGNAIHEGFQAAKGDVIILLEADRTSPPEDVCKVFDAIACGRAEYVNGSRFIYPREKGSMPWLNVVGNWLFAAWFMWFLGQRTSDVLCGLKGVDRRQFRRILENWGFLGVEDPFSDFELIFGAARLNLKISEVPTRYSGRQYGQTKAKFFRHGWMLARMAARATRVFRCR